MSAGERELQEPPGVADDPPLAFRHRSPANDVVDALALSESSVAPTMLTSGIVQIPWGSSRRPDRSCPRRGTRRRGLAPCWWRPGRGSR